MQKLKNRKAGQEKDNLAQLREEFHKEQEKAPVIKKAEEMSIEDILGAYMPKTRKVRLVVYSGCGCGGSDFEILREVPEDSDLQDGDRISEDGLEEADEVI
jgi:hypothetical protein